jgi:hypothetical protein
MRLVKGRLRLAIFSISLLILVFCFGSLSQAGKISFDPPFMCVNALDTFQVDITVDSDIHGIHCFFVKVGFDRAKASLDTVVEGPLLPASGSTFFFYKDTSGFYDIMSCILFPTNAFANGPGVLASMRLIAGNVPGMTLLHFQQVILQDTLLDTISAQRYDGVVIVKGAGGYHFGDATNDGNIDAGDVVYLINYLFRNGPEPIPILYTGDPNCDNQVDVGDVVYLINYLYRGGPEPCNPCD